MRGGSANGRALQQKFQVLDADGKPVLRSPEEKEPLVNEWELNWIRSAIKEFETVFAEEMRETATYFVPRRGIYHTPALVDAADRTFPAALRPHIPQKAKEDWKAADRCLAFNLLSASGFHVVQAVEACLEVCYQLFNGKPGETLSGWKDFRWSFLGALLALFFKDNKNSSLRHTTKDCFK